MRKLFAFLALTILLNGCDSPNSSPSESRVETFNENGRTYTLQLSARQKELQSFASDEEAEAAQNELRKKSTIELNETLWQSLKHAVDPFTVSVLDEKGRVKVGAEMLEFQKEQVLKHTPNGTEVELFYGADGKEVERELSLYFANLHDENQLHLIRLKNPLVSKLTKTSDFQFVDFPVSNFPVSCVYGTCYELSFRFGNQALGTTYFTRQAYGFTGARARINGTWYGFGHYLVPPELEKNVDLFVRVWGSSSSFNSQTTTGTYAASAQCAPYSYFVNTSNNEIPDGYFVTVGCKDINTRTDRRDAGYDPRSRHSVLFKDIGGNWSTLATNEIVN